MRSRLGDGRRPPKDVEDFGVDIAEDVDMLVLSCVMSGTERPTRIGRGSVLGPRAHVGHDCVIGEDVIVGGGAFVCGFAEVGDRTELKACVVVRNRKKIGSDCLIGMGAVITKDIPSNTLVYGVAPFQVRVRNREDLPWEGKPVDWTSALFSVTRTAVRSLFGGGSHVRRKRDP